MTDSAQEIATEISKALKSITRIPVEKQLWDTTDVAEYLRRSPAVVRDRIVCLPSFPSAIRIEGKMQPLWEAKEVIEWALSFKVPGRKGAKLTA